MKSTVKKTRKSKNDIVPSIENNILSKISNIDCNESTTNENTNDKTNDDINNIKNDIKNDIVIRENIEIVVENSIELIVEDKPIEVKVPKKRGRKPKNKDEPTIDNTDKNTETSDIVPEVIKLKRGRKPKLKQAENINKFSDLIKTSSVSNQNDTMILKLHIDSAFDTKDNDIHKNEDREKDFLNYKEDLESPKGYATHDSFMSNPEMIDFKNEDLTGAYNNQTKNKYKNISENNDSVCRVHTILENFIERDNWPIGTDSACFWCCNSFNNTPFGIPFKYSNEKFMVYGCFCSLECATAYNFSTQNNVHNIWENYSLINLLAHKLNYKNYVKSAPPREALIMFGGYMTIQKFREFCGTNKLLNILNYPMISSQHQVEEISDQSINNNSRLYVPLDTDRIKKIQQKFKLIRQKPVLIKKNTLEHTMNLKIKSEINIEKNDDFELSNEIIND